MEVLEFRDNYFGRDLKIEFTIAKICELEENLRIDSEFFLPLYLEIEKKLEKIENKKLSKICKFRNNKRIPVEKNLRVEGKYPYYGAQGVCDYIKDYIFDGEYLLVAEDGENLRSKNCDIAFNVKGKFWVNNHAHILEFENKKLQNIVQIFLNLYPLRVISGVAQPKLSKENLRKLKIPIPNEEFQLKIEELVKESYKQKELSQEYYKLAETLLLEEVGLKDFKPKQIEIDLYKNNIVKINDFMNIKKISEIRKFNRVDSEFYLKEYEEIEEKIVNYKGGFDLLKNFLEEELKKGKLIEFFEEKRENSKPYILIDNLRGEKYKKFSNEKGVICSKKDILIVSDGENSGEVGTNLEGFVGSTLLKLSLKYERINKLSFLFILKKIYFKKLNDLKTGSGVPHLDKEVLLNLKIPLIDEKIQNRVKDLIEKSQIAKKKSEKLLEVSKKAVEVFIEKNEKEALEFIKKETKQL
jgi:restriction endonuclease S subunit